MATRSVAKAVAAIDRAVAIEPANPILLIHRAQCLLADSRRQEALETADAAGQLAPNNPAIWDAIGTLESYANDQPGALAAYDRAVALAPQSAQFVYNRASVRRFLGDVAGAEADYDQVIALKPQDYEAYLNRAELRQQTAACNHITQLERLASGNIPDWRGDVQIRYALAKEYEDLGEYAKSFEHLRRGAKARREHLQYNVATDVATVQWIIDAFPGGPPERMTGASEESPIFVVGLPRSGTTLVERILCSHSLVSSAGELDCFALAVVDGVRRRCGRGQVPRQELIAGSAQLGFAALGKDYLDRARAAVGRIGRFIDKMPLNYLYCGLIRRALPNAKIVHVTRHPMATGYAMYKTLFKQGYPFSYDLSEIAQYVIAYRRLMHHWHATMPGAIHVVSYEKLIADQRGETRNLLAYCGLGWEEACVAFHENSSPVTTASASQVRRPLYDSSVSQWRHYETQLAELRAQLQSAGIGVDASSSWCRGFEVPDVR